MPHLTELILFAAVPLATLGQRPSQLPPPAFDDHAEMMKKLGLRALRPGPDPNHPATYDDKAANRLMGTLPDLMTLKDGRKVTRADEWPRRRQELVELFEREVYGRIPRLVPRVTWEVTGVVPGESGGVPTITKTLVGHVDSRAYPKLTVDIRASFTVPANAKGKVPLMVEFGGFNFPPRPGVTPWTEQAITHGWGYGSINPNSIQPDLPRMDLGVIALVNKGQSRKPDDWGALRAWAWGFSRLIDYFEKSKDAGVNPRQIGIEGVSRYGKAALVAQAFDPRVAVGFIGSSGEGGTKLHRRLFGEQIENLAGGEYYWMAGNLIKYGASDPSKTAADLPVDSHELIALCAPRPIFISHGVPEKGDAHWIDVHGSFMASVLAGPAYRLLGKRDLGTPGDPLTDAMPPVGKLIGGELAWRQHEGGHEVGPNWPAFFDWVSTFIPSSPPEKGGPQAMVSPGQPVPRADANSQKAHAQLVEKAKAGGIDLYFVGDSITRRWGTSDAAYRDFLDHWRESFFGWNAGNFGWGADTTANILWRLRNGELDGVDPKAVVLLAGTNDIGGGAKAADVVAGIRAILATVREKAPRATVILTAIFPRHDPPAADATIREVNRALASLADGKRVRFLDLNDRLGDGKGGLRPEMTVDGLHLARPGYEVWAEGLRPILTEILGPRKSTDTAPPPTGDPSAQTS